MSADGSIIIDTQIDTKGVTKGTKSIGSSLSSVMRSVKGIGAALGLAFSGAAIFAFVKKTLESFNLMSSGVGGSIKKLQTSIDAFKGALANSVMAAFQALAPYIITFVGWLTKMLTILAQVITVLFGVKNAMAGIGDETEDTTKKAKNASGALASFDQINVLQQPEASAAEDTSSALPALTIPEDLTAKVEAFKQKMLDFLQPVTDALGRLYEALKPLGETIWAGLKWAWDNILVPLGEWVITDAVPAFLDLLGAGAGVLDEALKALQPTWQWIWDNLLLPAGQWTGQTIIDALKWLTEKLNELSTWIKENPEKFQTLVKIWGALQLIAHALAAGIWLVNTAVGIWSVVAGIATGASTLFSIAMAAVASPIGLIVLLIAGLILIIYLLITHWEELKTTVYQIFWLIGYWVATMVMIPIINGFGKALDWVSEKFTNIFDGIKTFVKSVINEIIDFINGMIDGIVGGINTIIRAANTVGNIVPGYESIGAISAPQIPRLATGAVIPPNAQFAAILGDQKSGRNIEAPESLIRQIVRDEINGASGGEITVNIPVYLDNEKIYDGQQKVQTRRGKSLISSGATA